MISLTYNTYSLNSGSVVTTDLGDLFSMPERPVQVDQIAHADGGRVVQQFFAPKKFTLTGYVQGSSLVDMQNQIDGLKTIVAQPNGQLVVQVDTNTKRIVFCTAQNIAIGLSKRNTSASFSIDFVNADGVMWDGSGTTANLLSTATITTATSTPATSVLGSYNAQPDIKATITSLTASGPQSVTIGNGSTLKGVTITRTWTAGDVIEVDSLNMNVYVNSVATDFSGEFPTWTPGAGSLRWVDTFTARSVSLTATYTPRWL